MGFGLSDGPKHLRLGNRNQPREAAISTGSWPRWFPLSWGTQLQRQEKPGYQMRFFLQEELLCNSLGIIFSLSPPLLFSGIASFLLA